MAEFDRIALEFSKQELQDLVSKIVTKAVKLSPREQRLLLVIFAAAQDNVSHLIQPIGPDEPTPQEGLQQKILDVFIPDDRDRDDNNLVITARIGAPGRIGK